MRDCVCREWVMRMRRRGDVPLFGSLAQGAKNTLCAAPKTAQKLTRVFSKSTVAEFGKNLVGVWVNFGRYLVLGNQWFAKSHFWPFFGVFKFFSKTFVMNCAAVFWCGFWRNSGRVVFLCKKCRFWATSFLSFGARLRQEWLFLFWIFPFFIKISYLCNLEKQPANDVCFCANGWVILCCERKQRRGF